MTPEQQEVLHTQELMLYDYADHYAMADTNDEDLSSRVTSVIEELADTRLDANALRAENQRLEMDLLKCNANVADMTMQLGEAMAENQRLAGEAQTAAPVTIESLIRPIHQWQLQTFPRATALSTALHLLEEARELVAKPSDGEEMADILMLLIGIASITGTNLTEELRKKFEKNKARQWGTPDADGVVRHVEDAPTAAIPDPKEQ